MRLLNLDIKNIGPFKEGHIDFIDDINRDEAAPVTIITGENGAGKTIVLDAIRALFYGPLLKVERDIIADQEFHISFNLLFSGFKDEHFFVKSGNISEGGGIETNHLGINKLFRSDQKSVYKKDFVISYWTSKLSTDTFKIQSLITPDPENYLNDTLSGIQKNVEVTELICYFDYLRSSDEPTEKKLGEFLYDTLKRIIKLSINNGELKHVARKTLEPIIVQNGREVTLDKLSSGNLFLIQRLVSMLGKMYSVAVLNNKPVEEILTTPGLLLIDEAENHLHPKWQKTFISSITSIFPNLQIILTTHSPFIVASVPNAKVYVCEPKEGYSDIVDVTDEYSNKPIDEILLTPVFNTQPFNEEISSLIRKRKEAAKAGNKAEKQAIENQLLAINPEYFSYLEIDRLLE
nr:AAA family ATPase [uncultured Arsenicibacter sp.]